VYDLAAMKAELAGTIFAGKLQFSSATGSTNTDALVAARSGAPDGSVFFADEQTAGRGRGDHRWHSSAGEGLYVSVVMRPHLSPAQLPLIPLVAGLGAAEAVRTVAGIAIDLRWPNDLLIGPRKVGGILVESKTESAGLVFAVIGIGINVHQREFDPAHSTPATSLDIAAGDRVSRQALLIVLLKSLEREMVLLSKAQAASGILARVEQASTWLNGRRVRVHGPQECAGVTTGLDAQGFLLVRTDKGLVTVQTGGIRAAETE
jgi:BirA family transcriptional regulator, biotin operon repressor / biotin---[acetyl-CoA-carboxylase] ligase